MTYSSEKDHLLLSQKKINIHPHCLELFWTLLTSKRCLTCALEEALLWLHSLNDGLNLKHLDDGFVSYKHAAFWLLKMLIVGLEWCGLLWCLYQLFGLSFWRHPFTAEHPLLSKWCNATFLQIWWRNKFIYILDGLRVSTFSANTFFGLTIPLKDLTLWAFVPWVH